MCVAPLGQRKDFAHGGHGDEINLCADLCDDDDCEGDFQGIPFTCVVDTNDDNRTVCGLGGLPFP